MHVKKCTALSHISPFKESPLKLTFEQHGGLGTGPPYPGKSAYDLVTCPLYWWPQSITRGVVPRHIFIGEKKKSLSVQTLTVQTHAVGETAVMRTADEWCPVMWRIAPGRSLPGACRCECQGTQRPECPVEGQRALCGRARPRTRPLARHLCLWYSNRAAPVSLTWLVRNRPFSLFFIWGFFGSRAALRHLTSSPSRSLMGRATQAAVQPLGCFPSLFFFYLKSSLSCLSMYCYFDSNQHSLCHR